MNDSSALRATRSKSGLGLVIPSLNFLETQSNCEHMIEVHYFTGFQATIVTIYSFVKEFHRIIPKISATIYNETLSRIQTTYKLLGLSETTAKSFWGRILSRNIRLAKREDETQEKN